jgi:hypothetical protein
MAWGSVILLLIVIGRAVWLTPTHPRSEISPVPVSSESRSDQRESATPDSRNERLAKRYQEKAQRGMTDQEILSILQDYEALGLQDPPEVIPLDGSFREKQQEWYLAALDEALNLTPAQLGQARERMRRMLEEDSAVFAQGIATEGYIGVPPQRWPDEKAIAPFNINPLLWLSKESYAPWRLMDLTTEQEALTVKSLGEKGWSSALPLPEDPGDRIALFVPGLLARPPVQPAEGLFYGPTLLDSVRHLHPAQLRLALLSGTLASTLLAIEADQAISWKSFPCPSP